MLLLLLAGGVHRLAKVVSGTEFGGANMLLAEQTSEGAEGEARL